MVESLKSTVDQLFSGEIAESAKSKAENIASLMSYKMEMDTKLKTIISLTISGNRNPENL